MKHKALTVFAVLLVLAGLTMLIVPRISNRVGEQISHSTIGDFKALKSKATTDELTEKKESDEDGLTTVDSNDPQRDNTFRLLQHLARIIQNRIEDERKGRESITDKKLRRKIDAKREAHGLKHG